MKRLTGDKDYLCIMGKATDITANLNKISALYDFTILSSAIQEKGIVMMVIERRRREDEPETSGKIV